MEAHDFSHRSTQLEMMDDDSIGFEAFNACLRDLRRVNQWTFNYRPTMHWLAQVMKRRKTKAPVSILDVGSGGGDMLRKIANRAAQIGAEVKLTGVDLNPWSKKTAEQMSAAFRQITFETSNIFSFDPARQDDYIISSLFTHHLTDGQLVEFMRWMDRHSRKGWFINDLHRHAIAYFFSKIAFKLLRLDRMVQNDGPISVARAFTRKEWIGFLVAAGIPPDQATVKWYFPFRYGVARWKP